MSNLRAVYGQLENGNGRAIRATSDGHMEVALHHPRLPFGSIHTERLHPVLQADGVYGLNSKTVTSTTGRAIAGSGSGVATTENGMFKVNTGTTSFSFGTIQSRRRLRYRPGQGVIGRFAGYFTAGVASSIQVIGFGTAKSGFYFGYNGTSFGILHSTGGAREIQTMTITTASTASNDYVVTLPNTDTVNVTATNNGSTTRTAYEISRGTYPGWAAQAIGSTVVFVAGSAGPQSGTFSLSQPSAGTPAAGTTVETLGGVATTDTWVAQADWNGSDKADGSGPSGFTLDPTMGNVFEIQIQYLGFGSVDMRVEVTNSGSNSEFITVHTFNFPNTRTTPHSEEPSFPFTMAAYSAGSTTDVAVYVGSVGGFIEGEVVQVGPRMSYFRNTNGFVGSSGYYPLFTVTNSLVYKGRANQSVIRIRSISVSHDDATPIEFTLLRNATLVGNSVNFTQFSSNSSCTTWDQGAATCTFSDNAQREISVCMGQTSGGLYAMDDSEITLQPGESITFAARAVTGTATYVMVCLNTREEQ